MHQFGRDDCLVLTGALLGAYPGFVIGTLWGRYVHRKVSILKRWMRRKTLGGQS